ncbi:MAG: dihydrolipoamide acetyltransferase family protein [Microthrixaceae bacterium]
MAEIVMPQLGESVTEGTITRWFKQVGESVAEDEPLFEVSTDKVDTEVPAPSSGVLTEILVQEGDTVDVGTVLAIVGDASDVPAVASAPPATDASTPSVPATSTTAPAAFDPVPAPADTPPAPAAPDTQVPAPVVAEPVAPVPQPAAEPAAPALLSPLVRRLVEEHGIDPATLSGTGVGGRLTRDDVLAEIDRRAASGVGAAQTTPVGSAAPATPAVTPTAVERPVPARPAQRTPAPRPDVVPLVPGGGERVEELTNIRRLTGDAMVASKAVAPHTVTMVQVDFEGIDRVRSQFRDEFKAEEGFSLTYLPFISRAVVDALHEFPHMNASVGDGTIVLHDVVNLSIAVDLDFKGLLAPVVKDAHGKRLRAIARDINELAERARSRQFSPDDLAGGTFTLSNSGRFGTAMVISIINQPQVAIMSTDGVSRQPVVVTDEFGNESIGIHSVGNLTLAWDHRAFDGAYAAAFMSRVKEILETRDWTAEV